MEGRSVFTVGRSTDEGEEDKGAEYPASIRVRKLTGNLKRGRKRRGAWARGGRDEGHSTWGRGLAHGLAAYGAEDARRGAGHQSTEVADILGRSGRDVLIHRDDLVVL